MVSYENYTVGWLCAIPIEMAAAEAMLDSVHDPLPSKPADSNSYVLGSIQGHNIAIACLPSGVYGTTAATIVAMNMRSTFKNIRVGLMVGVGGGAPSPSNDIRLGDVVVSTPSKRSGGVIQHDYGKITKDGLFEHTGSLNKPPLILLTAVSNLRKNAALHRRPFITHISQLVDKDSRFGSPGEQQDLLFKAEYDHTGAEGSCRDCDRNKIQVRDDRDPKGPAVHYGLIASGNQLIKDRNTRDRLAKEHGILCFEMEAAGLMDIFPCLVIRGICDYSDSHKSKIWQPHAAATAAAYAKELLLLMPTSLTTTSDSTVRGLTAVTHILDSLLLTKAEDDRSSLITMKGRRVDGTCEWFTEHPCYLEWLNSPSSQILWASGGPGKGKTMLAIYLTQKLEDTVKAQGGTFLYYFCDSRDEKRNTAAAILRSLLYQLLEQQPHAFTLVQDSFEGQNTTVYTVSTFIRLWGLFDKLLGATGLQSVVCVLDGLDECEDKDALQQLLRNLKLFFSETGNSTKHFKLILLSRETPTEIRDELSQFLRVKLDPDSDQQVKEDVERYISSKINELASENILRTDILERVKKSLTGSADGTFLWVGFVTETLKGNSAEDVENSLKNLPRSLNGVYERMLRRLEDKKTGASVFPWIVLSRRPLTLAELETATGINNIKDQLKSFEPLLKIDNDTIHPVHHSVKDYLQAHGPHDEAIKMLFVRKEMHLKLAKSCLRHLEKIYKSQASGNGDTFLEYATLFWPEHLRQGLDAQKTNFRFSDLPFFRKKSLARETWWKSYWKHERPGQPPGSFTLLHLAAYFDIAALARAQLLQKAYVVYFPRVTERKDSYGRTPLLWAAANGGKTVANLLLDHGANLNTVDGRKMSALHLAVVTGQMEVIPLLLEKGADGQLKDKFGETPLTVAIWSGYKDIIQLLLRNGVKADSLYPLLKTQQSFVELDPRDPDHDAVLAEKLLGLQGELLSLRLMTLFNTHSYLFDTLPIALKITPISKLSARFFLKFLNKVMVVEYGVLDKYLATWENTVVVKGMFKFLQHIIDENYLAKLEKISADIWIQILLTDKIFLEFVFNFYMGAIREGIDIQQQFRNQTEAILRFWMHVIQNLFQNGHSSFIHMIWERFIAEWRGLITEKRFLDAAATVRGQIFLHVAALEVNDRPLAKMLVEIWVEGIRELMRGDFSEESLHCVMRGWADELFHSITCQNRIGLQMMLECCCLVADEATGEFATNWPGVAAEALYEAFFRPNSKVDWIFGEEVGISEEPRQWINKLPKWQLQTLLEFLRLIKTHRSAMSSQMLKLVPLLLYKAEKEEILVGMRAEEFGVDVVDDTDL